MTNGEEIPQIPQPFELLENSNPENPDIPEEAKEAIRQYEEIKARLSGPLNEWVLPTPDPKTEKSQP